MDINILNRAIDLFYDVHPEMNITMAKVFIFIAQRGLCTQKDLEVALGLTNSTASRNVSWWCTQKVFGKEGIGYLERFESPEDRRYKMIRLTKEGQLFYKRLKEA